MLFKRQGTGASERVTTRTSRGGGAQAGEEGELRSDFAGVRGWDSRAPNNFGEQRTQKTGVSRGKSCHREWREKVQVA